MENPKLTTEQKAELAAARDRFNGHGQILGACGHVIQQCRCTHGQDHKQTLSFNCDQCGGPKTWPPEA